MASTHICVLARSLAHPHPLAVAFVHSLTLASRARTRSPSPPSPSTNARALTSPILVSHARKRVHICEQRVRVCVCSLTRALFQHLRSLTYAQWATLVSRAHECVCMRARSHARAQTSLYFILFSVNLWICEHKSNMYLKCILLTNPCRSIYH